MKIGIFAPSDWFPKKLFEEGLKQIKKHGHEVIVAENVHKRVKDFMAGTVEERLADLKQLAMADVDIVWAAEGGYAATEIRHGLEAWKEQLKGKLLIGYSDVTNLHVPWSAWGGRSIYGPTVCRLNQWSKESVERLFELVDGVERMSYQGGEGIIEGEVEGTLIGGNLETFTFCLGTVHDPLRAATRPVILALEEYRQELSVISRQMDQILDSTDFGVVVGIVLGRFCQLAEEGYPAWAKGVQVGQMLAAKLAQRRLLIPVWQYEEWGHETATGAHDNFYPIMMGANSLLTVSRGWGELKMEW